jgi:radical SAM protein with 4Fe4S-binding SPASM domain
MTKKGEGTFSRIVDGFNMLALMGYPLRNFAVTVTAKNFYALNKSIIDWAINRNINIVRIDIDVLNMIDVPVADIANKLLQLRRYAATRGVQVPGFWLRPAENLSESTLENHVAFCGAIRGNSICVSPSGNVYGCGYSTIKFGDLFNAVSLSAPDGVYCRFVSDRLTGMREVCRGCIIEGQCGGGCEITQEFACANQAALQHICNFYRHMTREILVEQLQEVTKSAL